MNLVMPRAINCEFIIRLSKTKSSLLSDTNYSNLRDLRKRLDPEISDIWDLEAAIVDFSNPMAKLTSSVRYFRVIEPMFDAIALKLKTSARRMRSGERIDLTRFALRKLEINLTELRTLVKFIDPVHLALQKHLIGFVTPLASVPFTHGYLSQLIGARDVFFRTGEKADLEAYLVTLEELTKVIPRDVRVAFKEQYTATSQELSELEVAAMLAYE